MIVSRHPFAGDPIHRSVRSIRRRRSPGTHGSSDRLRTAQGSCLYEKSKSRLEGTERGFPQGRWQRDSDLIRGRHARGGGARTTERVRPAVSARQVQAGPPRAA